MDKKVEIETVAFFEFDNKRKMMSVIIKKDGVYKLYCKGADSAIFNRLSSKPQPFRPECEKKIEEYSKLGYRTLCMAMRILSEEEVKSIRNRSIELSNSSARDSLLGSFG
jgi:P-type E1-E2 ATPase